MYNIELLKEQRKDQLAETGGLCDLVLQFHETLKKHTTNKSTVEDQFNVNVRATYSVNNYRVDWEHGGKEYSIHSETISGLEYKILKIIERYG